MNKTSISEITDKLSPIERQIVPFLNLPFEKIIENTGLDNVSVFRALGFLENKGVLKIKSETKKIIELGTNGIYYKKNHLPERKLITILESNKLLSLEEAEKISKLTQNEFKVSLGVLKKKALISLNNGKITLTATKMELSKKSLEEQMIDSLPLELDSLSDEQKYALENLRNRRDIVEIKEVKSVSFDLTDLGKEIAGKKIESDLIEEITPEVIKNWNKNQKFRKYDLKVQVPKISGGKRHFVNQSIEYAKRIWLDLGFKEMKGPYRDSSFWIFDALFTPQDHPAREMQDTFFLDSQSDLPLGNVVQSVKKSHEEGIENSKGWKYSWNEDTAKRNVLRTHTTGLSARTLSTLKNSDLPAKFFAIGKVFRNETLDWKHGFEFYQTEGIVIDKDANLRHLLGYLKEFYKKMGFEKIKFVPSFFPYTEPSVEIQVFHPVRKEWIELGGAGIFRPEVTVPLLGKNIPVLAWGQGFDRIIMDYYEIKDLREMYENDLKKLREKKFWMK